MRERKSGPQSSDHLSRCVFCFSFFNVKLVNRNFQGRVVREKSTAIQRGAPKWDANPLGDTGGMPAPCQGNKYSYHFLYLPKFLSSKVIHLHC